MTQVIDITPAGPTGALTIHGMDDETKALLGYLARYTGRTLANYELDLRQFKAWATGFGLRNLLTAERYQLELYVRHMQDRGLAPATVNRRFGTVRGFFHFAHVDGLIAKDPSAYVATPKIEQDQQYRTYFETIDMAIVMRAAVDPLDRAVMLLTFDLALRVNELCSLDVDNVVRTPAGVFLRFVGKGNKLAEMLIPAASLQAVDAYLAAAGRTDGPLFCNRWGNRLTRANVQAIITRLSRQVGIGYRVTPHGVRRSHARIAVQQGAPIDKVADNLRHKDSRVTKSCYAINTGTADIGRLQLSAVMANLAQ